MSCRLIFVTVIALTDHFSDDLEEFQFVLGLLDLVNGFYNALVSPNG